jgi:hypothetical protein
MGRRLDIPWLGGILIPWVRGIKIPWVSGSIYHGKGGGGQNTRGRGAIYHG